MDALTLLPCPDGPRFAAAVRAAALAGDLHSIPISGTARDARALAALYPDLPIRIAPAPPPSAPPFDSASGLAVDLLSDLWQMGTAGTLAVADPGPDSLPALAYAVLTGRRVVALPAPLDPFAALCGSGTALIATPAEALDKAFIARLLDWQTTDPEAPDRLGLLTGRDAAQTARIVARLLILRACHAAGHVLPAAADRGPAEFLLIGAHGNEMHLGYGEEDVLCGRRHALPPQPEGRFDCGRACQIENRRAAQSLDANTVLLMSCDGFTPSQGLAPRDFSILFGLLDGRPAAVLAPFKHVQANAPLLILIEALARSAAPLGEIAHTLNRIGNTGMLPDPAFLVLGDPDLCTVPPLARDTQGAETTSTPRGTVLRITPAPQAHAVTLSLPRPAGDTPLAVLPMTPALRASGHFFALAPTPGEGIEVTVFRDGALDPGPLEVALVPAAPLDSRVLATGRGALSRLRLIAHVFGSSPAMDTAGKDIADLMHRIAAFPRPIEQLDALPLALAAPALIQARLDVLRRAAALRIADHLGEARVWMSQDHAALYPDLRRAGSEGDGPCLHCGTQAFAWRYRDPVAEHPARDVTICHRCGITADLPLAAALRVSMSTLPEVRGSALEVCVRIDNTGPEAAGLSLFLQLNEWRKLGIGGLTEPVELSVLPGETLRHGVALTLPPQMQDDIVSLQLFMVDAGLGLHFLSQKTLLNLTAQPARRRAVEAAE